MYEISIASEKVSSRFLNRSWEDVQNRTILDSLIVPRLRFYLVLGSFLTGFVFFAGARDRWMFPAFGDYRPVVVF
ncbi:hypothetical protein AQ725_03230 [Burkholderia pseudomallei]|nr:hypothetical protein EGY14_15705 [Burkholderia pseudomallei]OMR49389.1 hypothetical protein AQ725_03230 [Burkholderia pseudomallei]